MHVRNGIILIQSNKNLCYADKINWDNVMATNNFSVILQLNRNHTECGNLILHLIEYKFLEYLYTVADNEICSPECDSSGCWGKGVHQCLEIEESNEIY